MPRCTPLPLLVTLLLLGGCARVPSGVNQTVGRQLVVTLTVAGHINPSDYYFVVFNNANDSTGATGPVPVISDPWGNGFVAGSATSFVEYTGSQPGDGYLLYNFQPGSSVPLQVFSVVGPPSQDTPVTTGSNTLQFRIPLSALATGSVPAASINYLQINFIATNQLPVNSQSTLSTPKIFDALGNTSPGSGDLNHYITIPTLQNGTYSNSTVGSIERQGDVVSTTGGGALVSTSDPDAPNLDIVDWSVQVTQ